MHVTAAGASEYDIVAGNPVMNERTAGGQRGEATGQDAALVVDARATARPMPKPAAPLREAAAVFRRATTLAVLH